MYVCTFLVFGTRRNADFVRDKDDHHLHCRFIRSLLPDSNRKDPFINQLCQTVVPGMTETSIPSAELITWPLRRHVTRGGGGKEKHTL